MAGPIAATGAISNPTRYGALEMGGEQFTGLWTQAGPYRDAATAYLMRKFYQGNRFDRIIDGINREITVRLTDKRRVGNTIYNALTCPAIFSFYTWKYIQAGTEVLRVIADCQDGTIRDVTQGQLSTLYTKAPGAGRVRFFNIGPLLFFGDGTEQKKIMASSKVWAPNTAFNAGDVIVDTNGNTQVVIASPGAAITQVCVTYQQVGSGTPHYYVLQVQLASNVNWLPGTIVSFSGVSTYTLLNGQTLEVVNFPIGLRPPYLAAAPNVATFRALNATGYGPTADTGTATVASSSSTTGTSGGTAPAWNTVLGGLTTPDGTLTWQNHGPPVYDWGITAPTQAPFVNPNPANRQWRPSLVLSLWYSIIDGNGNVQAVTNSFGGSFLTGGHVPNFATGITQTTTDGDVVWMCCGRPVGWTAATVYQTASCVLDPNNNLQMLAGGGGGTSSNGGFGWGTVVGSPTTDGTLTWRCLGPGVQILTAPVLYGFSYHSIDGSVSTCSPLAVLNPVGSVLGSAGNYIASISGAGTNQPQVDQIWLFRTVQGGSIPLLLAQIPNPSIGTATDWQFIDTLPDTALNPFIQAPLADSGDAPPLGFTGAVYHLQRIWGFVDNAVHYSGGPDTLTGNGLTAFPPLNRIAYQAKVIKLLPITVENGGILVFTTGGIFIILGLGTSSNPIYSTIFCSKIILGNYDALDVFGTEIFMLEANWKVSSLRIQYPFDPQSGYTEVGFPISDQFYKVTTGGFNAPLINPATAYLSWNVLGTADTAMYVSDGAGHWFRMSMVSPPESGILWSPIASLAGGSSAVQSIELAPGIWNLLIGPATSGPILQRGGIGGTIWADNGATYPSWDVKGVNKLCSTGQWAEVAHISAKSAAAGARPTVSVLLGEIAPSLERPWNVLEVTSPDPPSTPRSKSVYSDRYALAQNGVADEGDCILTRFDYGAQAFGDELLDWGIFATTEDERKEEAQK